MKLILWGSITSIPKSDKHHEEITTDTLWIYKTKILKKIAANQIQQHLKSVLTRARHDDSHFNLSTQEAKQANLCNIEASLST